MTESLLDILGTRVLTRLLARCTGFDMDDFKKARDYVLRVMREAKLREGNTVRELMDRSNPTDRSNIEEYLDAASLTEEHTILELLAAMQMTDVPPESD